MSPKELIRDQARKHRALACIDPNASAQIRDHFFSALPLGPAHRLAGYWPKGQECDPVPILERALAQGTPCALPVVQKDTKLLKFRPWDSKTPMTAGPYGLLEPAPENTADTGILPDIVLVPLLAFDRQGGRLGQGGGYYDATLAALRAQKEILAVGIAYADQAVLFPLPAEPHDQKLDWVITPQGAQCFV